MSYRWSVPVAAARGLDRGGDRVFGEQEHGLDVDLHHATVGFRLLLDHAAAAADTDIVVEEIEATEAVDRRLDQAAAIRLIGDVATKRRRRAAFFRDHADGTFGKLQFAIG